MEQIKEQLTDIKSMNMDELTEFIISLGEKKFRAKQIYEWIHVKHVESFDEMTNISKKFIQVLKDNAILISLKKEEVQVSKLDGTRKYLFALDDGNVIESVLMKYKHGNSVCISSQVGCRMGCRFCASTLDGQVRGLRPSEMIDQIYQIGKDIGERISNVVVMGTGEPLDNYDNLLRFIELFSFPGWRHAVKAPAIESFSSASCLMRGTRPHVETVRLRWLILIPFSSVRSSIKRSRLS